MTSKNLDYQRDGKSIQFTSHNSALGKTVENIKKKVKKRRRNEEISSKKPKHRYEKIMKFALQLFLFSNFD